MQARRADTRRTSVRTSTATSTRPLLRSGSAGSDVRFLQQELKNLGYDPGTVDGIFGPRTERAVKNFQADQGLVVDGKVGKQTWVALARSDSNLPTDDTSWPAQLAQRILNHGNIALWPHSPTNSSSSDGADARSNVRDTANGLAARRSDYGNAPGGSVYLDTRLLNGLLRLANDYSFRINSIAGGSHSANSRHYAGISVDIGEINDLPVNSSNPHYRAFMQQCRNLGATEVLGPGDTDHSTHIHCAWPRS
jgi:zinc D-Ala-D-Ala carboxypeptidase